MAFTLPFIGSSDSKPHRAKTSSGPRAWTAGEIRQLRTYVKDNTPLRTMSLKLGRSEEAIRSKWTEVQASDAAAAAPKPPTNGRLAHHH